MAFVYFSLSILLCSKVGVAVLLDEDSNIQIQLHQLDLKIQTLSAEVAQLKNDKKLMTAQMQSLQNQVNAQKPGCQSGSHVLSDPTGHAHSSSSVIQFKPPFVEVPKVSWGTTALDIDHTHNIRLNTFAVNLNKNNFTLNVNTWADTGLYGVTVQWMACPAHI